MLTIYALHGFLGLPSDWNFLENFHENVRINPVDLFEFANPLTGLKKWALEFNRNISRSQDKKILMGYSMGGRLALNTLLDNPENWDGAIIISAHPGLKTDKERKERLNSDKRWAKRFESENWKDLMTDWNKREVFSGINSPLIRDEEDYNRLQLSQAFSGWSVATQDYLPPKIATLNIPILWVVGAKDSTYVAFINDIKLSHEDSEKWIAPNAGHRMPWEKPEAFKSKLKTFVNKFIGALDENSRLALERN